MTHKHHDLSEDEKKHLLEAYYASENSHPIVKFFKTIPGFWSCIGIIFVVTIIGMKNFMNTIYQEPLGKTGIAVISFLTGFLYLTLVFAGHHMYAHSVFLEYERWNKNDPIVSNFKPVVFYGFYHHHSRKEWSTELTIRVPLYGKETGLRGVVTSHWHGYSLIFDYSLLAIFLGMYMISSTVALSFAFGHEVGVWLIPFGHGWQHVAKSRFPWFQRILFSSLEKLGIFSNSRIHHRHHIHSHPYVYQSFTSSGLYWERLDKWFDDTWNSAYEKSKPWLIKRFYLKIKYGLLVLAPSILIGLQLVMGL